MPVNQKFMMQEANEILRIRYNEASHVHRVAFTHTITVDTFIVESTYTNTNVVYQARYICKE